MKDSLVRVENLSHRYSIQWAVKDVSFEIPGKGIYGLLGSNGAGKSTTMNIMSGVSKTKQGKYIYVNGDQFIKRSHRSKKNKSAFYHRILPLYTDTTVEEYLTNCAYLRMIDPKQVKAAVEEVLEKCAIMHFKKRLIRNLSGGYPPTGGDCPGHYP